MTEAREEPLSFSCTVTLEWQWRTEKFAVLMLGRVELAQICKGYSSGEWFYMLQFIENNEREAGSRKTSVAAMAVCVDHAIKILGAERGGA